MFFLSSLTSLPVVVSSSACYLFSGVLLVELPEDGPAWHQFLLVGMGGFFSFMVVF